jgi:DNA-binding IclR family transcriptional regulator
MGSPRIKVLAKAARLLEVLAEFPDSTPASLAQRLGEPRPTVYRLIQDLAVLGYVPRGGPATWYLPSRPGTVPAGLTRRAQVRCA